MTDKLEKIARMMGRTTFRDFRTGFSPRSLAGDCDADIKVALGIAQQRAGALAVQALETRYASTLVHESGLRRAWERKLRLDAGGSGAKRTPHAAAVQRLSSALAIRRLAGSRMVQHDVADYAWLVCSRRETVEREMRACGAWLDELCGEGERAFLTAMDVIKPARRRMAMA